MKVNQVVLWPRLWIAVPGKPPSTTQPSSQVNETIGQENPTSSSLQDQHHPEDRLFNYASQCIQMGVILMQLNDTAKEGDGMRSIINWKLLLLYFRARKRGTKYAFQAMRLLTYVKALCSEKMAHRIIHGQFVNLKGGQGKNNENDLQMEMLIKNHKVMLRGMCGNKTLKAVERSTRASHGLKNIVDTFDKESNVPPGSTSHTHASTKEDVQDMIRILNGVEHFNYIPNRTLQSFPNIKKSPLDQLDTASLHT